MKTSTDGAMFPSRLCKRRLAYYLNWRSFASFYLILTAAVLVYNELLVYAIYNLRWHDIQCASWNRSHCARILLVADPQILGEINSNAVEIWDSDRYLTFSYKLARLHFSPDIIIFLGDLMDEGVLANDEQYERYVKRLNDIFYLTYPVTIILTPGDNDIGGEFPDPVDKQKLQKFETEIAKDQEHVISTFDEKLIFYKVNRIMSQYPKHVTKARNNIRVVVTHLPLLYSPSNFVDNVMEVISPTLIFSGHVHENTLIDAMFISQEDRRITQLNNRDNVIYTVDLKSDRMFEFVVPTCSYRMGYNYMGYGAAVLDFEKRVMDYTVFWLPPRISLLWMYVFTLMTIIALSLFILMPIYLIPYLRMQQQDYFLKHQKAILRKI